MSAQPHVVDLGDAHAVVVPDWRSHYSLLDYYCGSRRFGMEENSAPDLYVLCDDASRAEAILAELMRFPHTVAEEIAVGRIPSYRTHAMALAGRGHAVACDTLGPACDSRRLAALHPPPEGPSIDFEWNAREKRYRMRCLFTNRNGVTASQRIVLADGPDWDEQIRKGYARFVSKKAPQTTGLQCLPHVAAALERLDWQAARALSAWRSDMEKAGIDAHHNIKPLVIAGPSIDRPGDLLSIELKGRKGSYLLSSDCHYVGGTSIREHVLDLKADLPATVVTGLGGVPASTIWGDPDLSGMTVSRSASTAHTGFTLTGEARPLPIPTPERPDEQAAARELLALPMKEMRIEGVVLYLMGKLAPSVRLHAYRTLMAQNSVRLDISPWLPGCSTPMILQRDHLVLSHYVSGYYSTTEGVSL